MIRLKLILLDILRWRLNIVENRQIKLVDICTVEEHTISQKTWKTFVLGNESNARQYIRNQEKHKRIAKIISKISNSI